MTYQARGFVKQCLTIVAALALVFTNPAAGQLPALDKLLEKTKGISLWAGPAWLLHSDELTASPARDIGIEGAISLQALNPDSGTWSVELHVSFEQFAGFEARNPELDLRARIEALPGATIYLAPPLKGNLIPYMGAHVGNAKIKDGKAFTTTGEEFTVEGATTQFGVAVGVVDIDKTGFFVELAYRHRIFESITYKGPANAMQPASWPRSLDASALQLRFGVQYVK